MEQGNWYQLPFYEGILQINCRKKGLQDLACISPISRDTADFSSACNWLSELESNIPLPDNYMSVIACQKA